MTIFTLGQLAAPYRLGSINDSDWARFETDARTYGYSLDGIHWIDRPAHGRIAATLLRMEDGQALTLDVTAGETMPPPELWSHVRDSFSDHDRQVAVYNDLRRRSPNLPPLEPPGNRG
jgi:hypothetical protein